jgi:hypothetical protein
MLLLALLIGSSSLREGACASTLEAGSFGFRVWVGDYGKATPPFPPRRKKPREDDDHDYMNDDNEEDDEQQPAPYAYSWTSWTLTPAPAAEIRWRRSSPLPEVDQAQFLGAVISEPRTS